VTGKRQSWPRVDSSARHVRKLLEEIELTDRAAGRRFHADHKTIGGWRRGSQTAPRQIVIWLEQLADFYRRNPPPDFRELDSRGEREDEP
jgi:hypothetical protein